MPGSKMNINRLKIKKYDSELSISRQQINLKKALISSVALIYFLVSFKSYFSMHILFEEHYTLIGIYIFSASVLSYLLVNGWINGSRIIVDREVLEIGQWPMFFLGKWKIPTSEIASMYIRNNIDVRSENSDVNYEIHALTIWGRDIMLIDGLSSNIQAENIKENISNFLHIVDIPSSRYVFPSCQFAN